MSKRFILSEGDRNEIRKMYNLLEYIDIPITNSGDTIDDTRGATYNPEEKENRLVNFFHGDFLELKNFIQKIIPGQNLKYIGAGAMGMGFEPRGDIKYPPGFTNNDFIGQLPPEGTPVILKVTTNIGEIKKIKDLVQKYQGQIPGVVSYYFVKEVDLPSEKQFSVQLGAPDAHKAGQTKEMRIDDWKKMWDNQWYRSQFPGASDEEIQKKIQRKFDNFIELHKKKNEKRTEKVGIICMDKIDPLTNDERHNVEFSFEYFYWLQFEHKKRSDNRQRKFKPASVIKSVYTKESVMKQFYDQRVKEKLNNPDSKSVIPDFNTFVETFKKLLVAINTVWSDKTKPEQLDLHSGNIGKKGNELVFFDMFV